MAPEAVRVLVHSARFREPSVDYSAVMFICLQHAKPWPSVGDNPTELQLIKQNHFPWIFFFWLPSLPQDPNTSLLQFVCWFFAIQSAGQSPLAGEAATGEWIRKSWLLWAEDSFEREILLVLMGIVYLL